MALIETSVGGPDIEEGTYPVTVTGVRLDKITPKVGPNAGVEGPVFIWKFELEDPETGEPIELERVTSTNTGPKSKVVEFLTALLGPSAGEPNLAFDEGDLIGKQALAKVVRPEGGYAKIEGLTAKPRTARTVRAAAAPAAEAEGDDLPF